MKAKVDLEKEVWRLRKLAAEVRALGHLIKWQQPDASQDEVVNCGLGDLLEGLGKKIFSASKRIESTRVNYSARSAAT